MLAWEKNQKMVIEKEKVDAKSTIKWGYKMKSDILLRTIIKWKKAILKEFSIWWMESWFIMIKGCTGFVILQMNSSIVNYDWRELSVFH